MLRTAIKIVLVLLLCLSAGAAGYLKYQNVRLIKAHQGLEAKLEELNKKSSMLQAKYLEKKTLSESLLRTKATLEGQKRAAETELEKLQADYEFAAGANQSLAQKCNEKIQALEAGAKAAAEEFSRFRLECTEREKKITTTLKEREDEYKRLEQAWALEKGDLQADIKKTGQALDRCKSNNARLAEISEDLVEKYKDKGVMGALLQKEPLTQVKKVELEQLVQEYLEKIERQRIQQQDGS